MTPRLDDPARVRRLEKACRRAPGIHRTSWWRRMKNAGVRNSNFEGVVILRLAMCIGIGLLGMLGLADVLHAQVLSLVAIILLQTWISQIRSRLEADPVLAVLAQFPVPSRGILGFQLRSLWPLPVFALMDGVAFWAVAWAQRDIPFPWVWLPVVALTQVAMLGAVVLSLLRWWPRAGCAPVLVVGILGFAIVKQTEFPLLYTVARPLLEVLAWLTPWGWLNRLAWELPRQATPAGLAILGLGITAVGACVLQWECLARSWTLAPGWREVAGQPGEIEEDPDAEATPPAAFPIGRDASTMAGAVATTPTDQPVPVSKVTLDLPSFTVGLSAALAAARVHQPGRWMEEYGWPGRWLLARSDAQDRVLLDLLFPDATPPATWRWALVLTALPCLVAWVAGTGGWVLAGLLVACLAQRNWGWAIMAGLAWAVAVIWPGSALLLGMVLPCAGALIITLPLLGGSWRGLPLALGFLGSVPRSWARLWRLMVLFGIARLWYGAPVVALVALAWGRAFHPAAGVAVVGGWLALFGVLPVFNAFQLARVRLEEIGLGRWWRTTLLVILGLALAGSVVAFVLGLSVAFAEDFTPSGLEIAGVGLVGILGLGAVLVLLLRHAYRRWVDLVPGA